MKSIVLGGVVLLISIRPVSTSDFSPLGFLSAMTNVFRLDLEQETAEAVFGGKLLSAFCDRDRFPVALKLLEVGILGNPPDEL
jgi:hypothetical protein